MGESANGRCAVKKVFWTLVDLSCTKRLFLQETDFFPDYFTRDKSRKNSFSKEFSCSCAIYKFRFGTLCMILIIRQNTSRYGATIYSYLLRMENKSVIFSGSKQIPQRNTILSLGNMQIFTRTPNFAVHFAIVPWDCPSRLYSRTLQYLMQKGKLL